MQSTRRGFLLGSASVGALGATGGGFSALPMPAHDPGLEAVARAVRGMTSWMVRPGLGGLDFVDWRGMLLNGGGGLAAFGEGEAGGPDRARIAADRALASMCIIGLITPHA